MPQEHRSELGIRPPELGQLRDVPSTPCQPQVRQLFLLPPQPGTELGLRASRLRQLLLLSPPPGESQVGGVYFVPPQPRPLLGVLSPRVQRELHLVPRSSLGTPKRLVRLMPSLGRQELEIQPSRIEGQLRVVPPPPRRPPCGCLPELPQPRIKVDVQAQFQPQLRLMSQPTVRSLRLDVPELPLAEQVLDERHVQPPPDSGRRAQLQELRVHQVPSWKRQGPWPLLFVPRQHHGTFRRLTARESQELIPPYRAQCQRNRSRAHERDGA